MGTPQPWGSVHFTSLVSEPDGSASLKPPPPFSFDFALFKPDGKKSSGRAAKLATDDQLAQRRGEARTTMETSRQQQGKAANGDKTANGAVRRFAGLMKRWLAPLNVF